MSISNDLRQAVLQAAIQGKLTKQLPEDGNAKDLLDRVIIQGNIDGRRVKSKNIRDFNESEAEFEIPSNWCWVQLGSVAIIARGGSPRPIKDFITESEDGINWIKIGDTQKNSKYIDSCKERIIKEGMSKSRYVRKGDFLLTNSMSFGRPYILNIDGCIHDGWLVISQPQEIFVPDFLYLLLSSRFAYEQFADKVSGAVVKNLNSDKVADSVFPLPPLSEQKRIVAKVEELMAKIDELEKTEQELEALKKAFPADMKASLLQAAMQGKLTEQLPEDGNAKDLLEQIKAEKAKLIKEGKLKKEKPLPDITEDEIPFDIPENWEWCRIGDLFMHASGKQQSSSNKADGVPKEFITTSNLYWGNFVLDTVKIMNFNDAEIISCSATKGDLLVCEGGAGYGRSAIWNYEYDICLQNHIHRLRPPVKGVCEYVYYCMYFLKENNKLAPVGTAMPGLSANRLKGLLIPLPPISEQKRIVEKLEKLLPLCDGLVC